MVSGEPILQHRQKNLNFPFMIFELDSVEPSRIDQFEFSQSLESRFAELGIGLEVLTNFQSFLFLCIGFICE
ncbi:hypothetical protein AYI68_g3592 [Smittium mucronatum]|uniref:Uncharacterized protein n=1 Tax=Smittium mucronatum TaxID=133383 RepID=A0A1R0GZN2_9FUNG|nr:hypothetical protein AYI68_g3592 [Smittium mucronatum]